ncbi:Phosphoglycolate phosphatase 1 [Erwinia amylovora Ea644]|uniref:HAD family hydrolase n=1 Tax=Erwinia amylovora TaxID=552 RepID=UPI0002CA9DBB|nr:HAD family phosphatase [Erwinia amylovora]CCP04372.1 Phosphoglycolate phosphatase 1 [Erwinia amylovora Ea644]CCP08442.1 Phosphoglycolate phosphatase 1 [Erwinia amylovora MR1]
MNITSLTVIFDIDGVIVDSEKLHYEVLQAWVPGQIQHYTPQQLIGLSLEETLSFIGIAACSHPDIIARVVDTYKDLLTPQALRPGVRDLIHRLHQQGIAFGFVSTAPRHICLANLALLQLDAPVQLIGGDDIARTKPFPDPYLEMLSRLNADAKKTVVIEDTDLGIAAAHQAGIAQIYAWPHALSDQQQYLQASAVIASLQDIAEFSQLNLIQ